MNIRTIIQTITLVLVCLVAETVSAQSTATITGRISDESNKAIELVNVAIEGTSINTMTNSAGKYELQVPANQELHLVFSHLNYEAAKMSIFLKPNDRKNINKQIRSTTKELKSVEITEQSGQSGGLTRVDPRLTSTIPGVSGGVEAVIKTLPGVSSNNELSSQYNVRGGNFDENLVYVNDIEIYRPFLIRSGQQEGLSFINSDLTSSILFSSGGYDAKYGDKVSSVLDITYKKPTAFAGSVSGSLLGGSSHLEFGSDTGKLSALIGVRYKSNQYLLKTMETKGDYKPSFTDAQTYLNYAVNKKLSIGFLGNYSRNLYRLVPESRETEFGTISEAYRLTMYFEGQEVDQYQTMMGALNSTYKPNSNLLLKFIGSVFTTNETESFDILGEYWLDQIETDYGKETFGKKLYTKGIGGYLSHARNELDATVVALEHKGNYRYGKSLLQWGVKYNRELIDDKINEWKLIDSADYSLPVVPDSIGYTTPSAQQDYLFELNESVYTQINMETNRGSGFVQNTWEVNTAKGLLTLVAGIRGQYWDENEQLLFSPRASCTYKPYWEKNMQFRFATGIYHQPPFYREMRGFDGTLNKWLKAQQSIHFVLGSDYSFNAWKRPFKFTTELYYKDLSNIVPYEIDNVRIRYFAQNNAKGYATGVDMRVNGEFVKGVESWASLSVMQTREDILDDYYYNYYNSDGVKIIPGYTNNSIPVDTELVEPGYIPRPTDQRVTFSLFFQDYLPKNPTFKMHLNLSFGSSLPFGPPSHERYKATYRMPPYKRVDIGFSKQIKGDEKKANAPIFLKHLRSVWFSVEVLNLLQISNTISYIWVYDVTNRYYAIPNYLTPRQLNAKLVVNF